MPPEAPHGTLLGRRGELWVIHRFHSQMGTNSRGPDRQKFLQKLRLTRQARLQR
jgi:hypothetical protein